MGDGAGIDCAKINEEKLGGGVDFLRWWCILYTYETHISTVDIVHGNLSEHGGGDPSVSVRLRSDTTTLWVEWGQGQ